MKPPTTRRASAREWIGLAVLALPTLLLGLDNNVLFLALPHLTADLAPSSTELLWMTDIYGFMIAGFLITMGTLGDRIGRRRLLFTGAVAFGLASILTAYATSPEMLIAARAILGIAGATLMPSTLALISNMFADAKQRGTAIAVWMSAFLVGGVAGPIVGGILLEQFWWGSVFLLGVPVMVLLLAAGPVLLPEFRDPQAGKLDLVSVGLSLVAILPAIYGLKELTADGIGLQPVLAIATSVLFAALFVRRQNILAQATTARSQPLVDLTLFRNRSFSAAVGVILLATLIMGGALLFVTQYLQLVEGLTPLRAALWMLPPMAGLLIGNMVAPQLMQRIRPGSVIAASLLVAAAGFLILTQLPSQGGLTVLVTGYTVASLGLGPLAMLGTYLVVGSAPPERAGSASSMSETSGELGIAMGVAVLGSVGTAVYRGQSTDGVTADVPADALEAARDTLASAVAAADHLPDVLATDVLESAREAFTNGLNVIAGVGAAAALAFAVVALSVLRQVPPSGKPTTSDTSETNEGANLA
nr:MFS transporter [Phytoactinopolyspora halophila]